LLAPLALITVPVPPLNVPPKYPVEIAPSTDPLPAKGREPVYCDLALPALSK